MNQFLKTPQRGEQLQGSDSRDGYCRQVQGRPLSEGPGPLYQCPAGKLSVTAELPWTDSGTGRDVDDKVHRLKWFSLESQT